MLVAVVAWLMVVSSLASQVVGLPQQIVKNHRRKSVEGLSVLFFTAGVSSYVTATWWALLERQWMLAVSRMPGALFTSVIVLQALYFRFRWRAGKAKPVEDGQQYGLFFGQFIEEYYPSCRFVLRFNGCEWREATREEYVEHCRRGDLLRDSVPRDAPASPPRCFSVDGVQGAVVPSGRKLPRHESFAQIAVLYGA